MNVLPQGAQRRRGSASPAFTELVDVLPSAVLAMVLAPMITRRELSALLDVIFCPRVRRALDGSVPRHPACTFGPFDPSRYAYPNTCSYKGYAMLVRISSQRLPTSTHSR
jgi:hypothetical protein